MCGRTSGDTWVAALPMPEDDARELVPSAALFDVQQYIVPGQSHSIVNKAQNKRWTDKDGRRNKKQ
ncbi:hypothetical protein AKJ16_DCAP06203 [Drosera capensis]